MNALRSKRTALVVGAAAVGLPLALLAQPGSAAGNSGHSGFTFTLEEVPGSFHFVDVPPKKGPNAPSVGDQIIFVNKLEKHGKRVGHVHAVCTFTQAGHAKNLVLDCSGSFLLRGSQLTVQTTFVADRPTIDIAITGGTGRFEGASGQVTAVNHPDGSSTDTFHVLLPGHH